MSTLIALKLNDSVVLATDSLLYDQNRDGSTERILSRTCQKIFEVSPGVFYGWCWPQIPGHPASEYCRRSDPKSSDRETCARLRRS